MYLLIIKNDKQIKARTPKTITLKPRERAGTKYPSKSGSSPYFNDSKVVATIHGRPSPKKTLTEFEPVTLPTASSAYFSFLAAVIDANVSGRDVPRATKVIALIGAGTPITHPKAVATYSTKAVTIPIINRDTTNDSLP